MYEVYLAQLDLQCIFWVTLMTRCQSGHLKGQTEAWLGSRVKTFEACQTHAPAGLVTGRESFLRLWETLVSS